VRIVTLRGGACLVKELPKLPLIAKIAEIEKQNLEPQRTRRNTEADPYHQTRRPEKAGTIEKARAAKPSR
jgi:hypothetical protein